jgi:hypothetical protein
LCCIFLCNNMYFCSENNPFDCYFSPLSRHQPHIVVCTPILYLYIYTIYTPIDNFLPLTDYALKLAEPSCVHIFYILYCIMRVCSLIPTYIYFFVGRRTSELYIPTTTTTNKNIIYTRRPCLWRVQQFTMLRLLNTRLVALKAVRIYIHPKERGK